MEGILYVGRTFGWSLDEVDLVGVGQSLPFFRRHFALLVQVALVAHEETDYSGLGELLDFLHPDLDVLEGFGVGDVVYHYYSMGSPLC